MNANTVQELNAHLNADETLWGPSAAAALRSLEALGVRLAFAEVARRFRECDFDEDPVLLAIVERALVLRVAIERRWAVAGASQPERTAAARVDAALDPHWEALFGLDDVEGWLEDIGISGPQWWGRLGTAEWRASDAVLDQALEAVQPSTPPDPPRSEAAWADVAAAFDTAEWWYPLQYDVATRRCVLVPDHEEELADWAIETRDPERIRIAAIAKEAARQAAEEAEEAIARIFHPTRRRTA